MDFIDKKNVVRLQVGEQCSQISGAFQHRSGRLPKTDIHFVGDDVRERGLAETGRPKDQHVVQRFATRPRRRDEDVHLFAHRLLADILVQLPRAQRAVYARILALGLTIDDAFFGVFHDSLGSSCGWYQRMARFSASRIMLSLSRLLSTPLSRRAASCGLYPKDTSAFWASFAAPLPSVATRLVAVGMAAKSRRWSLSRISTSRRAAVFLPMPGRPVNRAASSASTVATKSATLMPDRMVSASFGPTPLTRINSRNRRRSSSVAKPYNSS